MNVYLVYNGYSLGAVKVHHALIGLNPHWGPPPPPRMKRTDLPMIETGGDFGTGTVNSLTGT